MYVLLFKLSEFERKHLCVCVGDFHYNGVFLSRLIFCGFKMRVRAERFPCRPGLNSCVCVCLRGSFPGFKSSLLSILTNLIEPNVTINIYFTEHMHGTALVQEHQPQLHVLSLLNNLIVTLMMETYGRSFITRASRHTYNRSYALKLL